MNLSVGYESKRAKVKLQTVQFLAFEASIVQNEIPRREPTLNGRLLLHFRVSIPEAILFGRNRSPVATGGNSSRYTNAQLVPRQRSSDILYLLSLYLRPLSRGRSRDWNRPR